MARGGSPAPHVAVCVEEKGSSSLSPCSPTAQHRKPQVRFQPLGTLQERCPFPGSGDGPRGTAARMQLYESLANARGVNTRNMTGLIEMLLSQNVTTGWELMVEEDTGVSNLQRS